MQSHSNSNKRRRRWKLNRRAREKKKIIFPPASAIIGANRGKLRGERQTDTRGTSSK